MTWTQVYDPFGHWWLSTLVAAIPIVLLLTLLAGFRVPPHLCAIAGAAAAVIIAIVAFGMPARLAVVSFLYGGAFGFLKIVWIVIAAVFLYDISVETGQFEIMKLSIAAITPDRRLQVLLVAFAFGAFLEGAAGFGAPVAIAGAFMIGLGFKPFQAAVLNLIANTAPVAWGAIGTPVHVLAAVTALPESDLSAMVGRILPWTAVIVPFWLVRTFVSWTETFEVFPAILVVGISFAGVQYFWSNHVDSNLVDIAAGVASIIATLLFLRVWQPKRIWRFEDERGEDAAKVTRGSCGSAHARGNLQKPGCHLRCCLCLFCFGDYRRSRPPWAKATTPAFKTGGWAVPYLHQAVFRAQPVVIKPTAENAKFDLNWLSATGTGCFLAAVIAGLFLV